MRSIQRLSCAVFALLSVLSQIDSAHAQSAQPKRAQSPREDRDQHLVFDDDLLNADLSAPFGDPVFSRHLPAARVTLIRPRTSFVPELCKSIEHI